MRLSFAVGLLLALFYVTAEGFRFQYYRPYDVYKSRQPRWPTTDLPVRGAPDDILSTADNNQDYYKIVSWLMDVGKRRR